MIELRLNKMSVPLPTDINFNFIVENPYFTDASEYTEEITLSSNLSEIQKVFGAVYSHQCSKKKKVIDCDLISDNKCILRGKATTTEYTDSEIKIQLLGGNSLVNYMSKWSEQYIDEMDEMGKFIDSWSQIFTTGVDPGGEQFAKRVMEHPDNSEWIMLPAISEDNNYPINLFARYFPDQQGRQLDFGYPYGRLDNGTFALQPRLTAIVRKVIRAIGYEVKRFDAEKTPFKYVYYVNVKSTFYLHEMLPHWSINEFLDEIQKFFNCVFVFNSVDMTCDIISRSRFMDETITHIDDIDDSFNVDLGEENNDVAAANLFYKNDDIDISKMSNEYINERCEIVECNDETELQNVVLNGAKNIVGMLNGRQYIRHEDHLEEINMLGCLYDKDASILSLKIVPAAVIATASNNYVLDDFNNPISYESYPVLAPKGYSPSKSEGFDIDNYIHTKKEDEGNKLDIMAVAVFKSWDELPTVNISVMVPDPDPIRPGDMYYIDLPTKLWGGWTYHIDDVTGVEYSAKQKFDPTLSLRNINGYDTMYSMGAGSSMVVWKSVKHEFVFFDDVDIKNINKTYIIRGHKYLCEKIELTIDSNGIQKRKKGIFYQID